MPAVARQAALGYTSPGRPGSAEEARWKRLWLAKAQAVPSVDTLWVHKSIVEQTNALMLVLKAQGVKLGRVTDDWGWANRDIRGSSTESSYHRWGLALDLDATQNPQHTHTTTFPPILTRKAAKLLGFRWGMDFNRGWEDPMHFESYVSRVRARFISSRLVKPTKRSRNLAAMADLDVKEFCRLVRSQQPYGT